MWKRKQKMWMGLLMPVVSTVVFGALDQFLGVKLDPSVQTAIMAAVTGGAVYQIENK